MSAAKVAAGPGAPVEFHEVFPKEIEAVNARRKAFNAHLRSKKGRDAKQSKLSGVQLELEETQSTKQNNNRADDGSGAGKRDTPFLRPTEGSNLVGVALSGGGVRSASFCLGALQALDSLKLLNRVDYLSTVSGGGYIGTSMVAAMSQSKDFKFPFPSELEPEEVAAIQHIRDHSNYLFPSGKIDIFSNLAIYLRGIIANTILILPYLLLAAVVTIVCNPTTDDLSKSNVLGEALRSYGINYFGISLLGLAVLASFLAVWAFVRSFHPGKPDMGSGWTRVSSLTLVALLLLAFCELQPVLLDGMFLLSANRTDISAQVMSWAKVAAGVLAPFSAAVGFLSSFLGGLLKKGNESPSWQARSMKVVANMAIYLAAAAVPLILWIVYLYLSYWGICINAPGSNLCLYKAPDWVLHTAQFFPGTGGQPVWLYLYVGFVLVVFQLFLSPNANSLHRLYRDRLSQAFLFNPEKTEKQAEAEKKTKADEEKQKSGKTVRKAAVKTGGKEEIKEEKTIVLQTLEEEDIKFGNVDYIYAPYQIINTALNIQGSQYANQRGRNADFFIFSPLYSGSGATDYVRTSELEGRTTGLDLAAAMAISGAAASANMGANTIKVLSPTLAILNIRLGFWLPNPSVAASRAKVWLVRAIDQLYFWAEMVGRLKEDSNLVYLTDGGHIENLGIYELLRRRCQLIIAVDAEADPEMSFNSFIALQRYALIDLGVLVGLPWAEIRDASRKASTDIAKSGGVPRNRAPRGPHCAIGKIEYPGGGKGVLLYIKSSITGDENDYIVDYKRRYPDFPHETTLDQLFSEEQFEVYRALGFHTARRAFLGEDVVGLEAGPSFLKGRVMREKLVRQVHETLGSPRWKKEESRYNERVGRSRMKTRLANKRSARKRKGA